MNCEDFESNVNDLAREQVMEASVRARALAHRDQCEACARRLDDESALSFKLRALASETSSAKVPPLGKELLTALRGNRVAMKPAPLNSRWRYWATAGAAAAAIVLVVITVAVLRSPSQTSQTVQSIPSASGLRSVPTPAALSPRVIADERPAQPGDMPGRRRVNGKRRSMNQFAVKTQAAGRSHKDIAAAGTVTTVTADSTTEITTDFMPVGYPGAGSMPDGGQLVRVELPRSALVAFGLPMNVNRYDEKVKADVFFGADGMARAIRFVQ